jgi:hypothetical protein
MKVLWEDGGIDSRSKFCSMYIRSVLKADEQLHK